MPQVGNSLEHVIRFGENGWWHVFFFFFLRGVGGTFWLVEVIKESRGGAEETACPRTALYGETASAELCIDIDASTSSGGDVRFAELAPRCQCHGIDLGRARTPSRPLLLSRLHTAVRSRESLAVVWSSFFACSRWCPGTLVWL